MVTVERVSGRGLKGSDAVGSIGETIFRVVSFKDGKMWRVTEYPTRSQALEAAGLTE